MALVLILCHPLTDIVSCYQAGAIAGSLLAYPGGILLYAFRNRSRARGTSLTQIDSPSGRKWGLLVASLFLNLGAGIMLIANGSRGYDSILAGRYVRRLSSTVAYRTNPAAR